MNRGLVAAAQSMANSELRVGAIASNLANVSTPGFKRMETSMARFDVPGPEGRSPRTALTTSQETSFAQGRIKHTGRELDMALMGDGFFVLDAPEGELLTRNGVFLINEQGTLVSEQGHPVAWRERTAQLDQTFDMVVSSEGEVLQDGRSVGYIEVRAYRDNSRLAPTGDGNFEAPFGLQETAPDATVQQGGIELSNALAIEQLVDMIAAQRSYERSAEVMRTISENYQRLTRHY